MGKVKKGATEERERERGEGRGTTRGEVDLVSELEAIEGDARDEDEVIHIALDVMRGEFVQLDDRGDLPRPTPRGEHATNPPLGDLDRLNASLLGQDGDGLVRDGSENGQL